MDEIVYNALQRYYKSLELKGYISDLNVNKLLVLSFYNEFIYNDYRGLITEEDYYIIERALDCLFGSTCLIPYPDYMKMGKLYLGQTSEIAQRLKVLEDTPVLKLLNTEDSESNPDSDVLVVVDSDK